jgi:LAO/AO transport system kinase
MPSADDRRSLARLLSSILDARPLEAQKLVPRSIACAHRVGFSGPPGAGKSTLISAWGQLPLAAGRSLGVLAIDPTSPLSSGSVLGDRIRMDGVATHPDFYLRSIPSRSTPGGLCPNVAALLDAFDAYEFDVVALETVGVGQVDYAVRSLVDTFVLVLNPEGGDIVQAMKAGILEVAEIVVIGKADLPAARRMAREVSSVIDLRGGNGWRPPVIEVTATLGTGLVALDAAINAHREFLAAHTGADDRRRSRQRERLRSVLHAHAESLLAGLTGTDLDRSLTELHDAATRGMAALRALDDG